MNRLMGLLRAIYRNRQRVPDLPRFMTYIVTFGCNARCIMCDSWKKPSPDDLTLEEIERIFDQLPRLDAVRLTGGEPFVRRDLIDIARLAQERLDPAFLHVTTNGFLTDRIVELCEQRPKTHPLQLLVSVDGVGEKHDHVRGHDRAWDFVMNTLEALAPRRKELRMQLAVNQTIVDAEGAEHYRRLREILDPLGVRNNVVLAYDASATYSLEEETIAHDQIGRFTTFGDFSEDALRQLLDDVEEDLACYPLWDRIAKRYYVRGIRNRLLGESATPNPKCVALSSHFRLFPNGDVPVCQFNSQRVGSLRHQTFEEVWNGEAIDEQRQWVHACPGCWAECEILPNAIYTGDLLHETISPSRALSGRSEPEGTETEIVLMRARTERVGQRERPTRRP